MWPGHVIIGWLVLVGAVFALVIEMKFCGDFKFLEGRPVERLDHQVHTYCLAAAVYPAGCLFSILHRLHVYSPLTFLSQCGSHTEQPSSSGGLTCLVCQFFTVVEPMLRLRKPVIVNA